MANKTLKDMFPDVSLNEEQPEASATKAASKAASDLLGILDVNEEIKDRRIAIRVNSKTYSKFTTICKKKGVPASSILQMFISDYIRDNEELLG